MTSLLRVDETFWRDYLETRNNDGSLGDQVDQIWRLVHICYAVILENIKYIIVNKVVSMIYETREPTFISRLIHCA